MWKRILASNSPCLQILLLQLSQYDVNIEFLKREENVITKALFRVLPRLIMKQEEHQKDMIPVHMLTTEIPADSSRGAVFRKGTVEDTTSGLLMQVVMNGWPELRKDFHPLLIEY